MKEKFQFKTDQRAAAFCEGIVRRMVEMFGISVEEAIGRMNRDWAGLDTIGPNVLYHEAEEFWANSIYFGKDSTWWKNPPGLKPRPYP